MISTQSTSEPTEEYNRRILNISEDLLDGFHEHPFQEISRQCGLELDFVIQRIQKMLAAGTIRRVRQTLLAPKLAHGCLAAWQVPSSKLQSAFRFMVDNDPFSGHVVIRSTDKNFQGAQFNLWTTLKVPQGESLEEHALTLQKLVGARTFHLMPAKGIFTLGVGHMRRRKLSPSAKQDEPATMVTTNQVDLSELEWRVLLAIREEFSLEEINSHPWEQRAKNTRIPYDEFLRHAKNLDQKGTIGRFATFLEHTKPSAKGEKITRYNALFHWAVPKGSEQRAGSEIARHLCLTHCYWREGGPQFGNANIMGVVHGCDQDRIFAQKSAIDDHLKKSGIPLHYTNVFWGGKSEIKPSEISPNIYQQWKMDYAALK